MCSSVYVNRGGEQKLLFGVHLHRILIACQDIMMLWLITPRFLLAVSPSDHLVATVSSECRHCISYLIVDEPNVLIYLGQKLCPKSLRKRQENHLSFWKTQRMEIKKKTLSEIKEQVVTSLVVSGIRKKLNWETKYISPLLLIITVWNKNYFDSYFIWRGNWHSETSCEFP